MTRENVLSEYLHSVLENINYPNLDHFFEAASWYVEWNSIKLLSFILQDKVIAV